jgi:hypothetical protein
LASSRTWIAFRDIEHESLDITDCRLMPDQSHRLTAPCVSIQRVEHQAGL